CRRIALWHGSRPAHARWRAAAAPMKYREAGLSSVKRAGCVTLSLGPIRLGPATALIAIAVAACSIGDVSPALPPLPPNPPDMAVVNNEAARIFGVLKLPGNPELSRLRPAHPNTLAEWMFC